MISESRLQKKAKKKQLTYLLVAIAVIVTVVSIIGAVIVSYASSEGSETEENDGVNVTPDYSEVEKKFMSTEPKPKPEVETKDKTEHSDDSTATTSDEKEEPSVKTENDKTPKQSPRKQEPIILGYYSKPTESVNKDKPVIPAKKDDKPVKVSEDKETKPSVDSETPIVLEDLGKTEEPLITFPDSDQESEDKFESTKIPKDDSTGGSDNKDHKSETEVTPEQKVEGESKGSVKPEYKIPKETPRVVKKRPSKKTKVVYQRKHKYVMVKDDPDYTPDMKKVLQASKTNAEYDMMEKNKMAYETIYDLSLDNYIFTKTFGNSVKPQDDISMQPLDMNHPNLKDDNRNTVIKEVGLSNNSYCYEPLYKKRRFNSISYDGNKLIDSTENKFVVMMVENIRGIKLLSVIGTDEQDKRVGIKFEIKSSKPKQPEIVNNYVHMLTEILRTTSKGNFQINV